MEVIMYYIQPGQASSIHDLCSKSQVSHIMAKAVDDVEIISSTYLNGKWMMDNRTWYEFVLLLIEPDLKKF
jgi:hypothetical protein